MKYFEEFKRAMKLANFLALGVLFGTGVLPWLMEKDKTVANVLFLQSLLRIVSVYAGAVALIFIAEVIRTKAREKKGVTKYKKK
ncbi:MAG: hypothetical protein E7423_10075 [Ruminococcaceae bacterium]|jgi:predicted Kef-type K+ transport protein|nr:hypothetical protein [Oscillospiraceae bacterium]MBQ6645951.1 hypothetical protein [Clostridia bacterium]